MSEPINFKSLRDREKQAIIEAGSITNWSPEKMSHLLGVARGTVYRLLASYGIEPKLLRTKPMPRGIE